MAGRVRRSLVSFDAHRDAEAETGDEEMQVDEELASEEAHGPEIPKFRQQQKVTDADVRTSRQLVKMIVDQSYLTLFRFFPGRCCGILHRLCTWCRFQLRC